MTGDITPLSDSVLVSTPKTDGVSGHIDCACQSSPEITGCWLVLLVSKQPSCPSGIPGFLPRLAFMGHTQIRAMPHHQPCAISFHVSKIPGLPDSSTGANSIWEIRNIQNVARFCPFSLLPVLTHCLTHMSKGGSHQWCLPEVHTALLHSMALLKY